MALFKIRHSANPDTTVDVFIRALRAFVRKSMKEQYIPSELDEEASYEVRHMYFIGRHLNALLRECDAWIARRKK